SLSGPENSTRTSGRSQSRSSGRGGSTTMRYLTRKPHSFTTARNKSSTLRAAAALSAIGIADWLTSLLAAWMIGQELERARQPGSDFRFLAGALFHFRPHFPSQFGAIHHCLLHDADAIAQHPVHAQAGGQIPADHAQEQRHHQIHHLLLCRIHAGG